MALLSVWIPCALSLSAGAQESPPLPKGQILQAYKGGDLDSVLVYIKSGRTKPVFRDREDSLLAFKCLGVIYAADPVRREKGRYYFYQLLMLNAQASISDFYPGETVRQIFKDAREEYFETHPQAAIAGAPAGPPAADSAGTAKKAAEPAMEPRKSSRIWWWVGGGALATAAAGAAVYFLIPEDRLHTVHD